jgi:hypothetical protein
MELNTAKQIISEALNIAIAKGCFGLIEVQNIVKALEKIDQAQDVQFDLISKTENEQP